MKLKPIEIAVSALAAVAAAAVASVFGATGTLAGAAIGSAVATSVAALLSQSVARTQQAVQRTRTTSDRDTGTTAVGHVRPPERARVPADAEQAGTEGATLIGTSRAHGEPGPEGPHEAGTGTGKHLPAEEADAGSARRWRLAVGIAGSALAAFVLALGILTLVEVGSGRSLSSIVGGPDAGTTLGGVLNGVTPPTTTSTTTPTSPSTRPPPSTTPATVPPTNVPGSSTTSSTTTSTAPGLSVP